MKKMGRAPAVFEDYFKAILQHKSEGTEHTTRTHLQNLIEALVAEIDPKIEITHEPKKEKGLGRPDFRVKKHDLTIGYIETKQIGEDLDEILRSEQLERYMSLCSNIILTNYSEFILIRDSKPVSRLNLFYLTDKHLDPENIEKFKNILTSFLSVSPEKISKPEKLSSELAKRAKFFRIQLKEYWQNEMDDKYCQKLRALFDLFKEQLIEDLTEDEFIDTYVQTITYGLFLARLNSDGPIEAAKAELYIPPSLGVIKELYDTLKVEDIPDHLSWLVDEIVVAVNSIDQEFTKKMSFGRKAEDGEELEDPYIYFYEHFLSQYDKSKRKAKGVYYTPLPVVKFIIESIDFLLKRDFQTAGFGDEKVNVLDFACGTGTFLLEGIKKALEDADEGTKKSLIGKRVLKNFYGFEYLVAPYTISHLKLSQYLQSVGYELGKNERLKVYLTDTLDDQKPLENKWFVEISNEGKEANRIKTDEKVLVVMGNPPYSNYSRNNKPFILELIKAYKEGLGEKKINLNDDYIKFLRFAQCKVSGVKYSYDKPVEGKKSAKIEGELHSFGKGIVGVITANSYLDGITHRVMRKKLMETFDRIYIVNLHGSTIKSEGDQNVFDIMTGVTIALFEKLEKPLEKKEIYYFSTLESGIMKRDEKYCFLNENNISTLDGSFAKLQPEGPDWWFVEKNLGFYEKYKTGLGLIEIFKDYGSGIKTDRDELFIDHNTKNLADRIRILLSKKYDSYFIEKYNIKNSSSYNLLEKVNNKTFDQKNIITFSYRPFDNRNLYYEVGITSRPAFNVMQHFLNGENIGLLAKRQFKTKNDFNYTLVVDKIQESCVFESAYANNSAFPLYLYKNSLLKTDKDGNGLTKTPNFTQDFEKFVNARYSFRPAPEQIFGYIYSVLHCPTYRSKYLEYLKVDFPRVPFLDEDIFLKLAQLGAELIDLHLLKKNWPNSLLPKFPVDGNGRIEAVKFDEKTGRLHINKTQYFEGVSKMAWGFVIGGYKVIDHYLKDRKGRTLELEEIEHIKKVCKILEETDRVMGEIDAVLKDVI